MADKTCEGCGNYAAKEVVESEIEAWYWNDRVDIPPLKIKRGESWWAIPQVSKYIFRDTYTIHSQPDWKRLVRETFGNGAEVVRVTPVVGLMNTWSTDDMCNALNGNAVVVSKYSLYPEMFEMTKNTNNVLRGYFNEWQHNEVRKLSTDAEIEAAIREHHKDAVPVHKRGEVCKLSATEHSSPIPPGYHLEYTEQFREPKLSEWFVSVPCLMPGALKNFSEKHTTWGDREILVLVKDAVSKHKAGEHYNDDYDFDGDVGCNYAPGEAFLHEDGYAAEVVGDLFVCPCKTINNGFRERLIKKPVSKHKAGEVFDDKYDFAGVLTDKPKRGEIYVSYLGHVNHVSHLNHTTASGVDLGYRELLVKREAKYAVGDWVWLMKGKEVRQLRRGDGCSPDKDSIVFNEGAVRPAVPADFERTVQGVKVRLYECKGGRHVALYYGADAVRLYSKTEGYGKFVLAGFAERKCDDGTTGIPTIPLSVSVTGMKSEAPE